MPFHPINFLAAQLEKPQRFMPDNLGQELANAYKLYQMPGAFAQGRETQDLANQLTRAQIQSALNPRPTDFQLKMKMFQDYLKSKGGVAGEGQSEQLSPEQQQLTDMFMKQSLGLPLQSPEEKLREQIAAEQRKFAHEREMEEFKSGLRQKEGSLKGNEQITQAVKTQNQERIQAVDNLIPMLNHLKTLDVPGQTAWGILPGGSLWSPEKVTEYESAVAGLTDAYLTAKNLPKTNESIEMIRDKIFSRRPRESLTHFRSRIDNQIKELQDIQSRAEKALKSGKIEKDMFSEADPLGLF